MPRPHPRHNQRQRLDPTRQRLPAPEQLIREFAAKAHTGRRTADRVQTLVDAHFDDPARRDKRGRKAEELRTVRAALGHLIAATGWRTRETLDPNVRHRARTLVTTASHGQMPLAELMLKAKRLRGQVNRAGKIRNARRPVDGCDPLRIELPSDYWVERLHTVETLAHAGRVLGNCTKDNGFGKHDDLRDRRCDFYIVGRQQESVAMFDVVLDTNRIGELLGVRNDDVRLPRTVLVAIQSGLDVDGDDVDACLRVGAASIFANAGADPQRPNYLDGLFRLWWRPNRIVMREGRDGNHRWSSFRWEGNGWHPAVPSSRRRMDRVMTRRPRVAMLAQQAVRRPRRPSPPPPP